MRFMIPARKIKLPAYLRRLSGAAIQLRVADAHFVHQRGLNSVAVSLVLATIIKRVQWYINLISL